MLLVTELAAPQRAESDSLGATLRLEREKRGISIDEVAAQLKLSARQIKALENEQFDTLPGSIFIRGFVRNYARLLQIDPEPLLSQITPTPQTSNLRPTPPSIAELPGEADQPSHRKHRWLIPLVLVIMIGTIIVLERGWFKLDFFTQPSEQTSTAAASVSLTPSVSVLADPSATNEPSNEQSKSLAATEKSLQIIFIERSWIEVRDRKGSKLISQTNSAGSQETISGEPPLSIAIGNAPGVILHFAGQPVDLAPYKRQNVARFTLE